MKITAKVIPTKIRAMNTSLTPAPLPGIKVATGTEGVPGVDVFNPKLGVELIVVREAPDPVPVAEMPRVSLLLDT